MDVTGRNPFASLAPYELGNLAAHLVSADQACLLHRVLAIETNPARSNAWFEVREQQGDAQGYLGDVDLAREAAEKATAAAVTAQQ